MELLNVLHMNGGFGDASYASNSLLQKKVLLKTKPIIEEAITELYYSLQPKRLSIADLGCSSGPNTFLVAAQLIQTIRRACNSSSSSSSPPELQIYLNDLPGNDFNAIFRSLSGFLESLRKEIMGSSDDEVFFNGVSGSFYTRLFPSQSLHFVHSSYSLMWLSQVPEGAEKNKGNIYLSKTSPPSVLRAYYEQFKKDFSTFLKFRSIELVSGGRMVLTILGRKNEDPTSKDGCYIWDLLGKVLNDMVFEGMIEEEDLDTFNIPQYPPSPREVKLLIEQEGSFKIDRLEATNIHWTGFDDPDDYYLSKSGGYNVATCMRAVAEPLLSSHFGEAIIDQVFHRYREVVVESMCKERTEFVNVTVSLVKET